MFQLKIMTKEQIFEQIQKQSFLCVGLDSDIKKIPDCLLDTEDPIYEFNKAIVDATAPYCVAYKQILHLRKHGKQRMDVS